MTVGPGPSQLPECGTHRWLQPAAKEHFLPLLCARQIIEALSDGPADTDARGTEAWFLFHTNVKGPFCSPTKAGHSY